MRGRASHFWNAVMQELINRNILHPNELEGAEAFLEGRNGDPETWASKAGVDMDDVAKAADLISKAGNVVIVHSPDRPQDAAQGDMEVFADLALLLRQAGKKAPVWKSREPIPHSSPAG